MTSKDDDRSRRTSDRPEPAGSVQSNGRCTSHSAVPTALSAANKLQRPSASSNNPSGPSTTSRSLSLSATPSNANSPLSSRDSSPARPPQRQQHQMQPRRGLRSRKNSQDVSPNRPVANNNAPGATIPSAAAIQRALSTTSTPPLPPGPSPDPTVKPPRQNPQKTSGTAIESTSHWPLPPRIKSPPPSGSRRNSLRTPRRQESTPATAPVPAPSIIVQRSTPTSSTPPVQGKNEGVKEGITSDPEDQVAPTMRVSPRGVSGIPRTLETVQEASLPTTPGFDGHEAQNLASNVYPSHYPLAEQFEATPAPSEPTTEASLRSRESGSDSGGNRSDGRGRRQRSSTITRPSITSSKSSYAALAPSKSKNAAETSKNMVVETETVPSIPQAAIAGGPGDRISVGRSEAGSIRLKPSSETIKPKKDRKKAIRKAPSVASGTASSRADIFEAKVASAVDQANSSDSGETFVYESNPTEHMARSGRYHSRTPSATSMASLLDHRNARALANTYDNHRGVTVKRSMKFANNSYNLPGSERDNGDRHEGIVGSSRPGVGGTILPHHIPRHNRGSITHPSLFDQDAPFSQSSRPRGNSTRGSRRSSGPPSPSYSTSGIRHGSNGIKNGELMAYSIDPEAAHNELTPLIGTVRTSRRSFRRLNSNSLRQLEHYQRRRSGCCRRIAGCIVITIMVLLLIAGAIGFLFTTTKPLYNVEVKEIQHPLATEQEIMLDLLVGAVNPNIIAVTVSDMDVNVFAKSKHVGTDKWWREHRGQSDLTSERREYRTNRFERSELSTDSQEHYRIADSVDEGTDPIEDPEGDAQTMLLGRIFEFDSALTFDGSPLKHHMHYSVGEVRLRKPGNHTEEGGTERWERVMKYPFELIVRGILKYQLPLSSHTHTAPIGASIMIDPTKDADDDGDGDGSPETGNRKNRDREADDQYDIQIPKS